MSDDTLAWTDLPPQTKPILADKKAVARTLLTAFLLPWAFDIRSLPGTEWLIYVQLAFFVWTAVIFLLSLAIFKKRATGLGSLAGNRLSVFVCLCFATVGMFSGLLQHNETFKLFAFALPTLLFVLSLLMISTIAQSGLNPEDVVDVIVAIGVVGVLARIPIVAALFGIDLETVRYQILCGASTVCIAYVLARIPAGFRRQDLLLALFQAVIILLAVTRTEILLVFILGVIVVACGSKRILTFKRVLAASVALPAFALTIYGAAQLLPGNQLDRWTVRMSSFQTGTADMSGLERESQILFQLQALAGAGVQKLIGFGIAAPGGNYGPFEVYAASRGVKEIYTPTGFADNTYVSLIFLGGALGGGPLLLAQFVWLGNALRGISFVIKKYPKGLAWMAVAPLTVISFQISNIVAASFADRGESAFFGICLGVTGWLTAIRKRDARKEKNSLSADVVSEPGGA